MAGKLQETASSSDLDAHKREDPRKAHKIWEMARTYIDSLAPHVLTPSDITSSFTWDETQRTLDLTTATDPLARWAIISVYMAKSADYLTPLKFRVYGGAADIIQIGGDQSVIDTADGSSKAYVFGAGGIWIPLDSSQRVDYLAPAGATTKYVYLLGWSGGI